MRALFVALALAAITVGARADDLPNPADCAKFNENKMGGDAACDAAIAAEKDPAVKSVLLYRRAYMIIDRHDFSTYPKALADLSEAIRLLPSNWRALHERAYLYNEYGRWSEALADLDTRIALMPAQANGYQERAMARLHLGDLIGHYGDINATVKLRPNTVAPLIARADAATWLGQFDDAKKDLDAASALHPTENEIGQIEGSRHDISLETKTSHAGAAACTDANATSDAEKDFFVGDCTAKFLHAATYKERADALTLRSMGWLAFGDDWEARQDAIVAAALDPESPEMRANLAFAYLRTDEAVVASREFDRSIALKPTFVAYGGRAQAKLMLNDIDGALADAKKSIAIEPNVIGLTAMGDATFAKTKSYDKAKPFWIAAWRQGSHSDYLAGRLKEAGVPVSPPEEAAQK